MTDEKNEKKTKKLTLGGSKLSLGSKSAYPKPFSRNMANNKSVIVEVNKGKANNSRLGLNSNSNVNNPDISKEQMDRRLQALQKSQLATDDNESKKSTLSKLAQINKKDELEEIEGNSDATDNIAKNDIKTDDHIEKKKENLDSTKETVQKKEVKTSKTEHKKTEEKTDKNNVTNDFSKNNDAKKLKDHKKEGSETSQDANKDAKHKPKNLEPKKLKKSDILNMLNSDDGLGQKTRSLASIKRAREKEKRKLEQSQTKTEKIYREVIIGDVITVSELANKMTERLADVIRELMKLGIMATGSHSIDSDTAELIVTTFGHTVKHVKESDIENILIEQEDKPEDLQKRAPIVTIMGHVDHGKTSLLDAIKSTDLAASEKGGITQHIGAYSITLKDGEMITFIDTPGHEAFTEMRTRGAQVTDIVILVVAADDGIKAQTIEAINHAKAAEVPIIVAINKIDKPDADLDKVKNELLSHGLVPEEYGGDIITVGVSALKKQNLEQLKEVILLVADMQELKSNPNATASGTVIESRLDQTKGVITTVIVKRGTIRKGDIIIAGTSYGRIKRICNDKGRTIAEAGPSTAVEVFGLNEAPLAGDKVNVVDTDKQARDIASYRIRKTKNSQVTAEKSSVGDLFSQLSGNSKIKTLPLIIKGDVQGSVEAIINSISKIEHEEIKIKILHNAVGGINESDISLAKASNAIIIGFNVRANNTATIMANDNNVDIRYYSVIYSLIDDIKLVMGGLLSPIIRENYIGTVEIREIFNITKVGKVAGSYVTKGVVKRGAGVRLLRDNIVIHEGKLKTLKRFKEDLKEVKEGFECGIAFENYDNIKIGDIVEVFELVEEKQKL